MVARTQMGLIALLRFMFNVSSVRGPGVRHSPPSVGGGSDPRPWAGIEARIPLLYVLPSQSRATAVPGRLSRKSAVPRTLTLLELPGKNSAVRCLALAFNFPGNEASRVP